MDNPILWLLFFDIKKKTCSVYNKSVKLLNVFPVFVRYFYTKKGFYSAIIHNLHEYVLCFFFFISVNLMYAQLAKIFMNYLLGSATFIFFSCCSENI